MRTIDVGRFKAMACLLMLSISISGCYTGVGTAQNARDQLREGMSKEEVTALLGEPSWANPRSDREESGVALEWTYAYSTPWTVYAFPTAMLFTIVLTIPGAIWLIEVGASGEGWVIVGFDKGGRVVHLGFARSGSF